MKVYHLADYRRVHRDPACPALKGKQVQPMPLHPNATVPESTRCQLCWRCEPEANRNSHAAIFARMDKLSALTQRGAGHS